MADAFDAMTSNRPYHTQGQAAGGGVRGGREAGRQAVRPGCAAAFLEIREQIVQAMHELMPEADHGESTPPPLVLVNMPEMATQFAAETMP